MAGDLDHEPPSLESLTERIARARKPEEKSRRNKIYPTEGMQLAIQAIAEVIAGIVVGTLLGYYLDRWLGTSPWLFLIGFLLGCGASGMNIYRLASRQKSDMNKPQD